MANRTFFLRGMKAVDKNKKTYEEKAQETKAFSARMVDMQRYVDLSEEKRNLLLDLVLNGKSSDTDETLLDKGVIIYIKFLEVIDQVAEDFRSRGIDVFIIQGKTSEKGRKEISKEFRGDPKSKVVLISRAAGESLNLQATNEIFLYDLPDGPGAYGQVIGRICRSFSKFENEGRSFYIHYVIVDDTLDVYKPVLLSSKKQLEEDILHADTISLKGQGSFDGMLLKKLRKDLLWKEKEKRKANK